jgi:hypothetical protein
MTAMLDTIHALEGDIHSILRAVDVALATVPASDPLHSDLEEIRTAAQVAVAHAQALVVRTAAAGELRAA